MRCTHNRHPNSMVHGRFGIDRKQSSELVIRIDFNQFTPLRCGR